MYTIHFDVGSSRYMLNENNVDLIRQYFWFQIKYLGMYTHNLL